MVPMPSRMNDLLSICIPTFNHGEPLRKSLEAMVPQARQLDVPIYISDNASTDNTKVVVASFQKQYPYLFFKVNKENIGVDQNMIKVSQMASSKYVWAIGARRILLPGMLEKVYNLLSEQNLDLLVLNDLNNTFAVPPSQQYTSARKVFLELNRNLTGLGFQILPAEAWRSPVVQKYEGTEWTIVGLTLEFIADKKNLSAYFLSDPVATSSGPSHWRRKFFQIWANWKRTITSLPSVYSDEDKDFVLRNSVRYLFASPFVLLQLRVENVYNSDVFEMYGADLQNYAGVSPTVAYVISRAPRFPLKLYFRVYGNIRSVARAFIRQAKPINPLRKTKVLYS